jgi:hypothetical protein
MDFAAKFCELPNGDLLFAPEGPETGLPVTWEEYGEVLAAYERTHTAGMVMNWGMWLAAAGYGLYQFDHARHVIGLLRELGAQHSGSVLVRRSRCTCDICFRSSKRRQAMLREAAEGAVTAPLD